MANDPIEVLTVKLEADYDQLIRDTKTGVDKSERELDRLSQPPKKAQSAFEQLGGFLGGKFVGILATVGTAIVAAFSVGVITNFFSAIAKGMIDTNKQFENFETQFTTLLGSQEAAQKRITELSKFAIATPFELDRVVEASRLLETFAGSEFAAGEKLRQIGDSAAAVNAQFEETAFWTGRLVASLQAGRPFGEASQRLGELGIMSGDVRTKMEEMQKAGKDSSEIIAFYFESLESKFSGSMDRMSKTLTGLISNLNDFQDMLLREGGEELFAGFKEDAQQFYDIISRPDAQEALVKLAKALGSVLDSLRESITGPILEQLQAVKPETIESLSESLEDMGDALGGLIDLNVGDLDSLIQAIDGGIQGVSNFIEAFTEIRDATGITALNEAWGKMNQTIFSTPLYIIEELNDQLETLAEKRQANRTLASDLLGGFDTSADAVEDAALNVTSSLDAMGFSAEGVTQNMQEVAEATEEAADQFEKAREMFEGFSKSFLDAQEEIGEKRAELEEEHGEKVNEILAEYAEDQEDIVKEAGEALLKLEQDTAEQREEIAENTAEALVKLEQDIAKQKADAIANAQEDLAGLESDTQDQISDVKEEAQEKERRATEDHQREMQRLQQNYLLNLEDAVKNRDARAIVDLRRKHQMEMREKEEDFQVKRARDREDTEKRLEEIEEAEAKKKEEIKQALEEQLQDLEETEAEKKREIEQSQAEQLQALEEAEAKKAAEIEAKRAEDLEKLEENLIEQLNKEEENYQERQAMLDEALQRKLEAVAKQLADEKEITEEGAQAVLETLNETYGAGGDIDRLMEEFIERRKAQMEALAAFEQSLADQLAGPMGGGTGSPLEGGDGGGGMPLKLPTFALGGTVPGQPGTKQLIVAHAGELIIPQDQISSWLSGAKEQMSMNFDGNSTKTVIIEHKGSAPPGVQQPEIEAMAGVVVQALRDAGINARRK